MSFLATQFFIPLVLISLVAAEESPTLPGVTHSMSILEWDPNSPIPNYETALYQIIYKICDIPWNSTKVAASNGRQQRIRSWIPSSGNWTRDGGANAITNVEATFIHTTDGCVEMPVRVKPGPEHPMTIVALRYNLRNFYNYSIPPQIPTAPPTHGSPPVSHTDCAYATSNQIVIRPALLLTVLVVCVQLLDPKLTLDTG